VLLKISLADGSIGKGILFEYYLLFFAAIKLKE
jgi:hypothetical protein